MFDFAKRLVSRLPNRYQQVIKRHYYARQIRDGKFSADEKEYYLLDSIVSPGDWVLDIGANIGHYTAKLSELVGKDGRVIAFEPVHSTFELLTSNAQHFKFKNVTLLNLGASEYTRVVNMEVPVIKSGLRNYFQATISDNKTDIVSMVIQIDIIPFPHNIKLVKIDTEGHELSVICGMKNLLLRDYPIIIVEASSFSIVEYLKEYGYSMERLDDSPNYIFRYK